MPKGTFQAEAMLNSASPHLLAIVGVAQNNITQKPNLVFRTVMGQVNSLQIMLSKSCYKIGLYSCLIAFLIPSDTVTIILRTYMIFQFEY